MYRNRKRPDGSYVVHLDGEDLIVTKAMIDATNPQIMREYLRMLWAQEHRERREERCRDARGVRCQQRCSGCEAFCAGRPVSLEAVMEEGAQIASLYSVEDEVIRRETAVELYAALKALDDLTRQIIELLYFGDPEHSGHTYTEREVAVIVGMSQNGVHRRKVRGLDVLQKILEV